MNGVNILDVEKVITLYGFDWYTFALTYLAIIVLSVSITFIFLCLFLGSKHSFLIGCLLGLVMGLPISYAEADDMIPLEYEYQYKVLIEDTVSMDEFNERYQIIGIDGKILTVVENLK